MIILKNSRIINELTPGYDGETADIVIENEIIKEILPANTKTDTDATIIDMTNKTVIPGLIEAHLHLDLCGINTFEENVQPNEYRVLRALKLAQDNLKKGYTTVRDVGDRDNIIISLAKSIDEGLVVGPDILASGKILSPTERGNNFFGSMYLEADSCDEFRKVVRKQNQVGADFIKVMATGAIMNPGGDPGAAIITEDELKSLCDTSKFLNLPVAAHCHGTEGIKMCIRCGVRTIEHSTIMDDECIDMYLNSNDSFPIPTLSPMVNFLEFSDDKPKHYVEKSKLLYDKLIEGIKKAHKAGVKMGWATDAGVYEGSHGNGIYEFRARVNRAGFTPLECLIQATKNNSEILMIDDKVGTIEVGKKANLVSFNGNPDEDIEILQDVFVVIKSGKIIDL